MIDPAFIDPVDHMSAAIEALGETIDALSATVDSLTDDYTHEWPASNDIMPDGSIDPSAVPYDPELPIDVR